MRYLVAAIVALALAPAASGGVTIVSRDISLPLGSSQRSLASSPHRFNLVALHWQGRGTPYFRTRSLTGRWSDWYAADDDWGRLGRWREQGNPQWVGSANAIQYRLEGRVTRLRAFFLWSPLESLPTRKLSIAGSPAIIPRSGWGADEEIKRALPTYADSIRFALIHHTVNVNSYTRAQSPAIVRAIEIYHVKGNGWNDIGYNFLVDRFGQIFEGRYGGIDRNVVGAHSQGFNTGSVGVAVIGTFQKARIPPAAKRALEQLLAWRLDVAHLDPLSTLTATSGGNSRYRAGAPVFLRAISAHRDTYFTECPGNALYRQIPAISKDVAAMGLPKLYAPTVTGKVGGLVRFAGRLSNALPWTVTVVDARTGLAVASGAGTGPTIDWAWNALLAPPGAYTWTIDAGPTVRPAAGSLGAKAPTLALSSVTADPAVASTSSVVSYSISVPATVTGTLVDNAGHTVSQLFSGAKPAGRQSFTVDVSTVPDGQYTVVLQAQVPGSAPVSDVVGIQVDRGVSAFTASATAFSPNGDGVQDSIDLGFTLTQPAAVSLQLVKDSVTLGSLVSGSYDAGAPITVSWDGTLNGQPVGDGQYTLSLTIGSVVHTLPVTADTKPPVLQPISWRDLRFNVSEAGSVSLVVGDRAYVKKVPRPGSVYFWLRSRPQSFTVSATDLAGNTTSLQHP